MVDLVGVRGNSWRSLTGLVGVVCAVLVEQLWRVVLLSCAAECCKSVMALVRVTYRISREKWIFSETKGKIRELE